MKVLLKQPQYNGQLIEINKKYKEWVVLLKQPHVVKTTTEVLLKQPQSVVKTTTTKETTKRKERKEVFIPEFIPRESWDGFIAMRKTIKKPMTERAMTLAIGKLHRWHLAGYSVADILDNSILNSWQDLYEPKTKPQKQYQRRSV